ncbi:MAG: FkbM family methyltransferase [Pseudomonadota bacterium]|nr:FkbM family methyltransferase [Pseudomonadota bacterium]
MTTPDNTNDTNDTFRAQNGEDRWLDEFFAHKRGGYFVDVGAYDGVDLSNSYHFEQIGWSGILAEPDPDNAAHCRASRPGSRTFQCAVVGSADTREITFHKAVSGVFSTTHLTEQHAQRLAGMGQNTDTLTVPARTLDSLLIEAGSGKVDFVSIDVEGGELDVLAGFDIRRWNPDIVVIESNTKYRLPAIRDYFVRNGYAYLHSIDVNDFYQRMDSGMVRLIDAWRYGLHRIDRRLARLAQNLRRAWKKRHRTGG